MSRHKDKGRIEGPFVPMLVDTMKSPAWRAMSPYARLVYVALKSRYGSKIKNNGRIYLSTRDGAEETGFNKDTILRSLRELSHYGFIVMTEPGCLGVNGRGKAPHWRLTELGYMHDPPTRDFLKWDGELFHEQKSPRYYTRKKQNPVRQNRTRCPTAPDIPSSDSTGQSPDKLSDSTGHIDGVACPTAPDISRINHLAAPSWPVTLLPPGPASLVVVADFYARFDGANEAEKRNGGPTYPPTLEKTLATLGTQTLGTGTIRLRPAPSPLQFMASSL